MYTISVVRVINFIKMFSETPLHDKSPWGSRNTEGMSQLIKQYAASPQSTLCKVEKKQSIFTKIRNKIRMSPVLLNTSHEVLLDQKDKKRGTSRKG